MTLPESSDNSHRDNDIRFFCGIIFRRIAVTYRGTAEDEPHTLSVGVVPVLG